MSGDRRLPAWLAIRCALICGGMLFSAAATEAAPAPVPVSVSVSAPVAASVAAPLAIGETFTIDSAILGERRRINVYLPRSGMNSTGDSALPLLLMPDGGIDEDFLHIAGLLQVGASNGSTRPFLLAGIENTERRRDLTGPTSNAKDRTIAPRVGGAARFRQFVGDELLPELARRYRLTGERTIVGESLAGLFVVETLLTTPAMFDTYIAIDPSLWWNDGALLHAVQARAPAFAPGKTLYVASSRDAVGPAGDEGAALTAALARAPGLRATHRAWPEEGHGSIYHPAALLAFRTVLAPLAVSTGGPAGPSSAPVQLPAGAGSMPAGATPGQ